MTTRSALRPAPLGYDDLPRLLSLQTGDEKHDAAATSTLDILWVLFDRVLHVDAADPDRPDRDRFLLSKGHGPMAYYAVLAAKGFLSAETLTTYGAFHSPLGQHPDHVLVPGAEISSGSLGHGLALGVGRALALRAAGNSISRVFVLVGDAELDEGSNAEAIQVAARLHLDRLHVVVVDNDSSTHGWPGGIAARFGVEGWSTATVDGRDHDELYDAFTLPHPRRPHAVIGHVERKDS